MEKQGSQEKYIQLKPRRSLGIIGILYEALKITIKNGKIVVSIILPVYISYMILAYSSQVALGPVTEDLVTKAALMPKDYNINKVDETLAKGILKDVRYFLTVEFAEVFIASVIFLIFVVVSVHSSSEAYVAKVLSLKDAILGMKGRIKRPIVTSFFMGLISFSMVCFFLVLFCIISVMTGGYLVVLLIISVTVLGVICFVYVAALWMLSLVVSVLEENSSGLKAIDRAGELMKRKKVQGCVLKLLFTISVGVIYMVFSMITKNTKNVSSNSMVITIPRTWVFCVVKLFMFEVFTVFYHECKAETEGEVGFYALVDGDYGEA